MADETEGRSGPTGDGAVWTPPRVELPRGGGALRAVGEKFSVETSSGTATVAIPLRTTPARAGVAPRLTLTYDSGAGNGPFGVGWHLSLPAITRRTDKGVPRYRDDDVHLLSGTDDLVRTPGPPQRRTDPLTGAAYDVERFRPRVEGLHARVERWRDVRTGDVHWRSVGRDGMASVYGRTAADRVADPDDPSRVWAWLVSSTTDPVGNAIVYRYLADGAQRYVRSIRYGNRVPAGAGPGVGRPVDPHALPADAWMFEVLLDHDEDTVQPVGTPGDDRLPRVRLDLPGDVDAPGTDPAPRWRTRPDPFTTWRPGFEVRTARRVRRVLMLHRFDDLGPGPTLVGSTDLDYDDLDETRADAADLVAHPGSTSLLSRLVTVAVSGYRREHDDVYVHATVPPVELGWSPAVVDPQVHDLPPDAAAHLPAGLAAPGQWVDLDGDGAAGLLTEHDGAWWFAPNLGEGRVGAPRPVAQVPTSGTRGGAQPRLLDLDGDGRLDLTLLDGPVPGRFERAGDGWSTFRPLPGLPTLPWGSSAVELVDLTGDGLADVVDGSAASPTWYRSLGDDGFELAGAVGLDDLRGWPPVARDATQLVQLADLNGDGLVDVVRVRHASVEYWPNRGHGRFGPRVLMADAPHLDAPDAFDPARVRFVDADGSGTADLVYLHAHGPRLHLNRAGAGWSGPLPLPPLPPATPLADVQVADLLGRGTGCLVWSSALPGDQGRHVRYVDLAAAGKPHLLTSVRNGLGGTTTIRYASSTQLALADRAAGRPWRTRLPFPLHVVVETRNDDDVAGSEVVSRYTYRDGWYDGEEREARGFALVERRDADEPTDDGPVTTPTSPPSLTRTWFHTGRDDDDPVAGAWEPPGGVAVPPHVVLPAGLSPRERRDACRALKGRTLREEVYGLDGGPLEARPYVVTDQQWQVRVLQPRGADGTPGVHLAHQAQELARHHERRPGPPRTRHTLTLEVDDHGDVLQLVGIGYGRTDPDPTLRPGERAAQARHLVTYTRNDVTEAVDRPDAHRVPQPAGTRTWEVTVPPDAPPAPWTPDQVRTWLARPGALRLLSRVVTRYRRDDLTGLLPPGRLEPLALPGRTDRLALPDALLADVFGDDVDDDLLTAAGYVRLPGGDGWWTRSGELRYSPGPHDDAAAELAHARAHFFLPRRFRDPFHRPDAPTESHVAYDEDLLVLEVRDPVGNRTTAGVRDLDGTVHPALDHRVMAPVTVMDPNRNLSHVLHDALGLVVATATAGSPEDDPSGDTLDGLAADLTRAQVDAFLADPAGPPARDLLGAATSRLVLDLHAREHGGRAVVCATVHRETHVRDEHGRPTRLQVSLQYSDGSGREAQRKVLTEPAPGSTQPRWTGTGWHVLDGKGQPVRSYEPFFSPTPRFEPAPLHGVSALLCHDPLGRVVATLDPDHTWEKVVLHPWGREQWDTVDTLALDPLTDPDVGTWFRRLDPTDVLPGWLAGRLDGTAGPHEQDAARKALALAGTPGTAHTDALGNLVASVAHQRTVARDGTTHDTYLHTSWVRDVEGRPLELVDQLGRCVQRSTYGPAGALVRTESLDAGRRRVLPDALGQESVAFDERGHRVRGERDALRRPVRTWLRTGDGPEVLVGAATYGEDAPHPERHNLRTRTWRTWDQSGRTTTDRYDVAGNLVRSRRRLARDHRDVLDWSRKVPLDPRRFVGRTRFDALAHPVRMREPDGTRVLCEFNVAGLLQRLRVQGPGDEAPTTVVADVTYDAHGRRTRAVQGNGTVTTWDLDPLTFRLRALTTTRPGRDGGAPRYVQRLAYAHDPAGSTTRVVDLSGDVTFHAGARTDAGADHTYDALYRLVRATGRERADAGPTGPHDPRPRHHPADVRAVVPYVETYAYDAAGNVVELRHRQAVRGGTAWVRTFEHAEPSPLEPGRTSNRLTATRTGAHVDVLSVDGDGYDPHGAMLRLPHHGDATWDHGGRLRSTGRERGPAPERTWYVYDGGGTRVRKVTERAGRVVREDVTIGGYTVRTRHGRGTVVRTSVDVLDDRWTVAVLERRTEGTDAGAARLLRYRVHDALGSVTGELDETARWVSREEYTPYGSSSYRAVRRGEAPSRYRFTGRERDDETGLSYHGARYYAPWLCRWTSPDPQGTRDGPNVYAYVDGRPTRRVDPTGTQGTSTYDIGMAYMWDRMGREFDAIIEGFLGGDAHVNPRANTVTWSPPEGGVGGVWGGPVLVVTLRMVPIERNPSPASLMGLEVGASFVPVLDPAERLVTGTTVTGQETSRGWAAVELGVDVVPFFAELRATRTAARVGTIEARAFDASRTFTREVDLFEHIGAGEMRGRRPTTTNPTCRGDLCVADVGAHEANLRRPATETPLTNEDLVRASGRDVSVVEAPIGSTGEAAAFLDSAFEGLVREGRLAEPVRARIPAGPPEPGNYMAVVDGPQGGHAIHATVTDEVVGRQFIAEGRLVTPAEAAELAQDGVRVTQRTTYRTEFYDPQNGVCLAEPGPVKGWVRLE